MASHGASVPLHRSRSPQSLSPQNADFSHIPHKPTKVYSTNDHFSSGPDLFGSLHHWRSLYITTLHGPCKSSSCSHLGYLARTQSRALNLIESNAIMSTEKGTDHTGRNERKTTRNLGSLRLRDENNNELILVPTPSRHPDDPLNWYVRVKGSSLMYKTVLTRALQVESIQVLHCLSCRPRCLHRKLCCDLFRRPDHQPGHGI